MTANHEPFTRERIDAVLGAFEDGDAETAASFRAADGTFVDPHYPEPEYRGPEEVRAALDWALDDLLERPGLTVRQVWEDDGTFAMEVDTHHTVRDGSEVDFPRCSSSRPTADGSAGGGPTCRFHRRATSILRGPAAHLAGRPAPAREDRPAAVSRSSARAGPGHGGWPGTRGAVYSFLSRSRYSHHGSRSGTRGDLRPRRR